MPDIDDAIQKAMQDGKFDHLPGKGKPLKLDDNPHADPEQRLAYHVLQSSGYSLPWIELRKEIEAETGQARADLRQAAQWRSQPQVWSAAVARFEQRLQHINQRIGAYNLQAPLGQLQIPRLMLDAELARL